MDISFIIINYKTPELCYDCISSIRRVLVDCKFSYEVILIDNSSKDGSFEKLHKLENNIVHVYETPYNGGFGYGNNRGVEKSRGEYLFFLNSDTILYPDTVMEMWRYLKLNPDVGIMGCMMHDGEKKALVTSHSFENTKSLFIQTFIKPLMPQFIKHKRAKNFVLNQVDVSECDWVSGAGMLMPRYVFEKVGGWDERYFLYMEDEALCYHVHKNGYRIVLFPKFGIMHFVSQSGGSAFSAFERYKSKLLFYHDVYKKNFCINRYVLIIQARHYMSGLSRSEQNNVIGKLKELRYD